MTKNVAATKLESDPRIKNVFNVLRITKPQTTESTQMLTVAGKKVFQNSKSWCAKKNTKPSMSVENIKMSTKFGVLRNVGKPPACGMAGRSTDVIRASHEDSKDEKKKRCRKKVVLLWI